MRSKIFPLLVASLMLVTACASLEKKDAEAIALSFVQERVKFFTSSNQSTTDIPSFVPSKIDSYQQGKDWVVVMHIEAEVEGEQKSNDLTVVVDQKGKVKSFNGKPIVT